MMVVMVVVSLLLFVVVAFGVCVFLYVVVAVFVSAVVDAGCYVCCASVV